MEHLRLFSVFFEGMVSFFSPCILPLLPIYISILSNSSVQLIREGNVSFRKTPLFKNTVLFILGISTTFFILGSSVSFINKTFSANKDMISFFGGLIIIIMGLFYIGLLKLPFLQREKRINMEVKDMKPITAYLLGFTFSFGWTPCIGPILASVLVMASGSKSIFSGNVLILVYTLGFIIPFILIAVFYNKLFKVVDGIKKHMNKIKAVGGIILIISGAMMTISGGDKTFEHFYNKSNQRSETPKIQDKAPAKEEKKDDNAKEAAPDFTLMDQYGKTHTLSQYKGKIVFLNFWATWCPPCKAEMPDIEKIYKKYGENKGDVIILGVSFPNLDREGNEDHIKTFLKDSNYTFPVVFDEEAILADKYYINAFPTTFIIDKDGNVKWYNPGAMDEETMKQIIESAK